MSLEHRRTVAHVTIGEEVTTINPKPESTRNTHTVINKCIHVMCFDAVHLSSDLFRDTYSVHIPGRRMEQARKFFGTPWTDADTPDEVFVDRMQNVIAKTLEMTG